MTLFEPVIWIAGHREQWNPPFSPTTIPHTDNNKVNKKKGRFAQLRNNQCNQVLWYSSGTSRSQSMLDHRGVLAKSLKVSLNQKLTGGVPSHSQSVVKSWDQREKNAPKRCTCSNFSEEEPRPNASNQKNFLRRSRSVKLWTRARSCALKLPHPREVTVSGRHFFESRVASKMLNGLKLGHG